MEGEVPVDSEELQAVLADDIGRRGGDHGHTYFGALSRGLFSGYGRFLAPWSG
jgi:hypothetical protein